MEEGAGTSFYERVRDCKVLDMYVYCRNIQFSLTINVPFLASYNKKFETNECTEDMCMSACTKYKNRVRKAETAKKKRQEKMKK